MKYPLLLSLLALAACANRYDDTAFNTGTGITTEPDAVGVEMAQLPSTDETDGGVYKIGQPYKIEGKTYQPQQKFEHLEEGMSSWYGEPFHGKKTANGERFNKNALTAAHRTLQMPSMIRVTNLANGKQAVLRVNDRGPFSKNRVLDVSEAASKKLGFWGQGTTRVRVEVMPQESKRAALDAGASEDDLVHGRQIAGKAPPQDTAIADSSGGYESGGVESAELDPVDGSGGYESTLDTPPAKPTKTATNRTTPNQPYRREVSGGQLYVQAGAFSNPDNAHKLARQLSTLRTTMVQPVKVDGTTFYRVRLGPVAGTGEANSLLGKVQNKGYAAKVVMD
jgi:rare lipoprotein A